MARMRSFRKLLIANRGEIAVRIARACRDLEIPSVAIYSEADADAPHARIADEAVCCGPAPARESYLAIDRIVDLALESGADAVHPGYGFLSENPDFAAAVASAGLTFIGPSADTIRALGDKLEARRSVAAVGIPIVPGSLEALSDAALIEAATAIGYPLMLKASAGGGGRGLRRIDDGDQLAKLLPRARSEAQRGFGGDIVYLEKCLVGPRHVEVQILGDAHGNLVHLFERDCSVQRRHQKLIEEAPAPGLLPPQREFLGQTAILAAKAFGYSGVGTVEFLIDGLGKAYFLEMNTRIQVEHPITECITGIDLVVAGIEVAAGRPLPWSQTDIGTSGAALECRIYAEDPERGFLPSPGMLTRYRAPEGPGVRVDSGVSEGSEISVHYDALLAKLICWGRSRSEALSRMRRALDEFEIEGVKTTLGFHRRALREQAFVSGRYDTRFVERLGNS